MSGEAAGPGAARPWLTKRKIDHDSRATGIRFKNQHLPTFFHFFEMLVLTVSGVWVYKAVTDEGGGAASD
jgi:hypothetical protein